MVSIAADDIYLKEPNVSVQALHGDIAQSARERTLLRFREGKTRVLVATDVAARGLDIPNVDLVVHYELPHVSSPPLATSFLFPYADRPPGAACGVGVLATCGTTRRCASLGGMLG